MSERLNVETAILTTIERYLVSLSSEIERTVQQLEENTPDTREHIKLSMRLEELEVKERIINDMFIELKALWSWK